MATKNDVTGDTISSKPTNDAFRKGWDRVFGNERQEVFVEPTEDDSVLTAKQVCQAIEEYRRDA